MDKNNTGKIIAEARKQLNMTQKDLAEKLFISDKAVSKWERGLCFPDIGTLIPLSEILNISLYDLLRGEKMNQEEVEQTLKNTIIYSNSELKKRKKKYTVVSLIVIGLIIVSSIISVFIIKKDNQIGAIVDRDTLYPITYYVDYKTTLTSENPEKLEQILMRLAFNWKERIFKIKENTLEIAYDISYQDIVKAYNDKTYVKRAMLNNAIVVFTTIQDAETFRIKFDDSSYTISKEKLMKAMEIDSFEKLLDENIWYEKAYKKLKSDDFIKDSFDLFTVKK